MTRGNKMPSIIFNKSIILLIHGSLPTRIYESFSSSGRFTSRKKNAYLIVPSVNDGV
jgi:hypothetical protein